MTDYVQPPNPLLIEADPTRLSTWGGENPPIGFIAGAKSGYAAAVANNRYAYQLRVGDALDANTDLLEKAGYHPPQLVQTAFHIPIIGSYFSFRNAEQGTMFQAIMAHGADIGGPDERYANATAASSKLREDIAITNKMIDEAKAKNPELGIRTLDEIHNGVVTQLQRDMSIDHHRSWIAAIGAFIGGTGNIVSPSDPFAPIKAATAPFGGIGTRSAYRILSMGVVQAGLGLTEEATDPAARRRLLGMPEETAGEIAYSTAQNFVFGMAFGALGEGLAGQHGRAAMNESYKWLSISKREAQLAPMRIPPPEPPVEVPEPPPIDIGALAARPAGPTAFERLGGPGLPGLPRGKLPTTAAAALAEQIPIPREGVSGVNAPEMTEGAALAHVPRDQRASAVILDRFKTKSTKVRAAKTLDHVDAQMGIDGVAPQDLTAPTRPLSPTATLMPDVRVWNGPGAGIVNNVTPWMQRWISKRVDHLIEKDPGIEPAELAAREYDPETWKKKDKILADLNKEKANLQRVIDLHSKVAAGDKKALDATIRAQEAERMRTRSPGGKARVLQEQIASHAYFKELQKTRPGGTRPPAPKHLDEIVIAERIKALEAKNDAIFEDVQRSFSESQGALDLTPEAREALETYIRGTTRDWINSSFRWPKDVKRLRKEKSPYDIKQTVGPTKAELFKQRELDMAQLSDPLATEGAVAGEGPIDIATRVNKTKLEAMAEPKPEDVFTSIGKFMEDQGIVAKAEAVEPEAPKTALPKERVAQINADWLKDPQIVEGWQLDTRGNVVDQKTGNIIGHLESEAEMMARAKAEGLIGRPGGKPPGLMPKPVVPRLPSGEAYGNLAKLTGFDLDGENVGIAKAWEDVKAELEAFDVFNKCSKVL